MYMHLYVLLNDFPQIPILGTSVAVMRLLSHSLQMSRYLLGGDRTLCPDVCKEAGAPTRGKSLGWGGGVCPLVLFCSGWRELFHCTSGNSDVPSDLSVRGRPWKRLPGWRMRQRSLCY